MEENKNLNLDTETETVAENVEEVVEDTVADYVSKAKEKKQKTKKEKLLKNEIFFKKGSYSIAITAIVLVGIIVFNILLSALSNRFVLEIDMTAEKENSISAENIAYIKNIDEPLHIIVCAAKDEYAGYIGTVAQQSYGVQYDAAVAKYYSQTIKLIQKYGEYNNKITLKFVDTQSPEFTQIASSFDKENLKYGDIIVSKAKEDGTLRYKKVGFEDVYVLEADESYAAYGINVSTVVGNNIETSLTSAIAYVTSNIETKVAIYTGHSTVDYTESYKEMLENNNYVVETVTDTIISEIPDEYDLIVIPGPKKDFAEKEIKVISKFLDNDGKLGKGMLVFADATAPYLENFYTFLAEWGVEIQEGILFETSEDNYIPDDPTTLGSYNSGKDYKLEDYTFCLGGRNVPMQVAFEKADFMATASIMETPDTVVAAPKGTTANWKGAGDYTKDSYSTVIECLKSNYDENDEEIETRVAVFSSLDFLDSEYNETGSVDNKDLTLVMTERASGTDDMGISFVAKSIATKSFAETVSQQSATIMMWIFMVILPLAVLVVGIVVYIKRRNS